jgi:hypothetical protein
MYRFMAILTLASMAATAAEQSRKSTKEAKAVTKAAPRQAVVRPPETEVPAGAKEIEPNLYRYTDPQGKTWIYKRTLFGLMKHEETAEERAAAGRVAPPPDDGLKVVEDGETLRFSRPTPFGESRWTRKKTDPLDESERAAWERAKKKE